MAVKKWENSLMKRKRVGIRRGQTLMKLSKRVKQEDRSLSGDYDHSKDFARVCWQSK